MGACVLPVTISVHAFRERQGASRKAEGVSSTGDPLSGRNAKGKRSRFPVSPFGSALRNRTWLRSRGRPFFRPGTPPDFVFHGKCEIAIGVLRAVDDDSKVIENFRDLVRKRLGGLGLAVLDARLSGEETKSLVGSPALGSPGKWTIKKVVGNIKALAMQYAASLGDPDLLRRIERAMAAESETIGKRRVTMAAARQGVGAGASGCLP